MHEKSIRRGLRAVPFGQKLVAAGIAVVIGSGFSIWSRNRDQAAATAVLSFDGAVAPQVEPEIMQAREPAVVFARSILNDDALRELAAQAGAADHAEEVRLRLELEEPSANVLQVRYPGGDQKLSAAVANAAANLLLAWRPQVKTEAAPSIPPAGAATAAANKRHHFRPSRDVRDLEAQMAAVDQKLSALNAEQLQARVPQKTEAPVHPSSANIEQRHALESQLAVAEKRLDDLRTRYTDEYPEVDTEKENIAEIQRQLAALRPGVAETQQATSPQKAVGVGNGEADRLRRERESLVEAIANERRHEALRNGQDSPREAVPGGEKAALPALDEPKASSPFSLVHAAVSGKNGSLWPWAVAGVFCGLLYLAGSIWRYRMVDKTKSTEDRSRAAEPPEQSQPEREELTSQPEFPGKVATPYSDGLMQDDAEWSRALRRNIARTPIGRAEEVQAIRDEVFAVRDEGLTYRSAESQKTHYEDLQLMREKIRQNPNSWTAHLEKARMALTDGNFETAIEEMNLAMPVAPEKMKPKLSQIITHMANSMDINL
ncbi:hypothetical protein [Acidobacterium sp. S8]|uniref:hypothetical protein n=1 Tax=Acidobacterium sp. S8 TaxID=1641854 RepID=UPI00131B2D3E|nr:hypothetical protein [Acidobacterium sp. S8]